MSASMEQNKDSDKDILVVFTSQNASLRTSLPQAAIAVPSSLNRVGLSQVVAHLLGISSSSGGEDKEGEGGDTKSFEFTITSQQFDLLKKGKSRIIGIKEGDKEDQEGGGGENGDLVSRPLLRTSLKRYARILGLSSEDTLHLEFAPAIEAPKTGRGGAQGLPVRDWVSTLACGGAFAIAGLTDGTLSFAMTKDLLSSSSSSTSSSSLSTVFSAINIQGGGGGESNGTLHYGGVTGVDIYEASSSSSRNNSSPTLGGSIAMVASSGKDCVVRLWNASMLESNKNEASIKGGKGSKASSSSSSSTTREVLSLGIVGELIGADDSCGGVAFDPTGSFVACGDARGSLMVWECQDQGHSSSSSSSRTVASSTSVVSAASTGGSHKRPRSTTNNAATTDTASSSSLSPHLSRSPILRVNAAHSGRVSDVCWLRAGQLASASWDHTISVWDVEDVLSSSSGGGAANTANASSSLSSKQAQTTAPVTTLRSGKVITSITASPLGGTLATGHADNTVRIWDPRGRGGSAGAQGGAQEAIGLRAALSGASSWVSDVSFHTSSGHHVAAATHGGLCLLWDIRAPQTPLFEIAKHSDKALAVAWMHSGGGVISGGADSTVHVSTVSIGGGGGVNIRG
jgi:ribosome biogenesis protein YTM1